MLTASMILAQILGDKSNFLLFVAQEQSLAEGSNVMAQPLLYNQSELLNSIFGL